MNSALQFVVPQVSLYLSTTISTSPLGDVVSRKLKSAKYTKTVPGAPDGEYVILQFATSFKNKKDAVETVTPLLDESGESKVSGYFIK